MGLKFKFTIDSDAYEDPFCALVLNVHDDVVNVSDLPYRCVSAIHLNAIDLLENIAYSKTLAIEDLRKVNEIMEIKLKPDCLVIDAWVFNLLLRKLCKCCSWDIEVEVDFLHPILSIIVSLYDGNKRELMYFERDENENGWNQIDIENSHV